MIAKSLVAALLPLTSLAGFLPFPVKSGQWGPNFNIGPHQPCRPIPIGFPKTRTCTVKANGDGSDDSQNILNALHECNYGGHVIFSKNEKYIIGTALDMTFLNDIDIDIRGYVQFTNDTDYWQAHAFRQIFQNATTFFELGGSNVNVYGGGTLDGNGQIWYDLYAQNDLILRPILFGTVGLHGGSIGDLHMIQSPQYHNWVANSTGNVTSFFLRKDLIDTPRDVIFYNLDLNSVSSSSNAAKNTDGWDLYRSDNIVIQDTRVNNGDDCVSFKPNSTNMLVQNLWCNGSHGISVGSLGQYKTEVDIVENIYVYNISMNNAENGARIKVWPGVPSTLSADLQGGGGTGAVKNITYDTMEIFNCDYGLEITQCYGQSNLTLCNQFPSSLTISDITMKNIKGTTSTKFNPVSGYLVCSSPSVCQNIYVSDIALTSPAGAFDEITCTNIPEQNLIGINCTSLNKGQS